MQRLCRTQALDGCQRTSASLPCQYNTTWTRHPIDKYCTSTTFSCLATLLDTAISPPTQHREQRFIGGSLQTFDHSIDTQFEFHAYLPSLDDITLPQCD